MFITYRLSLEEINRINDDIRKKIPGLNYEKDIFATSVNLIVSGNYYEGYEKYIISCKRMKSIPKKNIIQYIVCRLMAEKKFYEARKVIEDNLVIYPKDELLNNNLAVILFRQNEPQLAFSRVSLAFVMDPLNKSIKNNYMKIAQHINLEGMLQR